MKRAANHGVPARYFADAPTLSQGRSTADHRTHNPETAGSTPTPASTSAESENLGRSGSSRPGAARRKAAGKSDSASFSAVSMIAAKREDKRTGGGRGSAAGVSCERGGRA